MRTQVDHARKLFLANQTRRKKNFRHNIKAKMASSSEKSFKKEELAEAVQHEVWLLSRHSDP